MRDEINSELETMESLGVITRNLDTDLTDWVSSRVYSMKSSGQLRMRLNLTDLNKPVKRSHYMPPPFDEVWLAWCACK